MITRLCCVVLLSGVAFAQQIQTNPPGAPVPPAPPRMQMQEKGLRIDTPDGKRATIHLRHRFSPNRRWWKDSGLAQKVGLSDAQIQRLDQAYQDYRLKLIDVRAGIEREELKLQPLLEASTPDEARTLAQIDRVAAQRGELEKARVQMTFAVRRILTPEQWKQLNTTPASTFSWSEWDGDVLAGFDPEIIRERVRAMIPQFRMLEPPPFD